MPTLDSKMPIDKSQWQVRPRVLMQGIAIVIPLSIVVSAAIGFFAHPVRVWLADGKWCAQFSPDGRGKILYGDECDR